MIDHHIADHEMTAVAWTPLLKPDLVPLVAIHAHSALTIDRDSYLSNLSSRIQRMVNASPDPKAAGARAKSLLIGTGGRSRPNAGSGDCRLWGEGWSPTRCKISCGLLDDESLKYAVPMDEGP